MKKHILLIMNIILILLVLSAAAFVIYRSVSGKDQKAEKETTAESVATVDSVPTETSAPILFKVGIVQHADKPASKECYEGFKNELSALGVDKNLELVEVVETDDKKCDEKIKKLVEECDLIYAVGEYAAKSAASASSEIPVVFAAVSNPDEIGLVKTNEKPGGNVTGVSNYTPCFEQIDLIPVILPDSKRIAAMYSDTDEEAVLQVFIAEKEAEDELKLDFDKYPVGEAEDIKKALSDMLDDEADVIYLPIDDMIYDNIDTIVEFSYKNKIPIICADERGLKAGAFATCTVDYDSIGEKSADLMYQILFEKLDPAELPVVYKYDCHNYVNKEAMNALEIELPGTALNQVRLRSYSEKTENKN